MASYALTLLSSTTEHLVELEPVEITLSASNCTVVLGTPDGSTAATAAVIDHAGCTIRFEPDRWGTYDVLFVPMAMPSVRSRLRLEVWPVVYEGLVARDLTIPIAGVYPGASGDEIALYGEPVSRRAGSWWTVAGEAAGGYARGLSADGITFGPIGAAPLLGRMGDPQRYSADWVGYGRIVDLGSEWVMHTHDAIEIVRWTDTVGPFLGSAGHTAQVMKLPWPRVVDWTAEAFDGEIGTHHAIVEDLPDGTKQLVFAYQGDIGAGKANTVRILHAPIESGELAGGFERPAGCDPTDPTYDGTKATLCEPIIADDDRAFGVDTPWFVPRVVTPYGVDSLRLTALYHPTAGPGETRENKGWASWRREIDADEDTWVFEGPFLSLDQLDEGMKADGTLLADDLACTMGDHTIVVLDGETFVYVPVSNFRMWSPPVAREECNHPADHPRFDPTTCRIVKTAEYLAAYARWEEEFQDFIAEDLATKQEIYYAEGGSNIGVPVQDLFDVLGIPVTSDGETPFHCGWCIAWDDESSGPKKSGLPVSVSYVVLGWSRGGYHELAYTGVPAGATEKPCEIALADALWDRARNVFADELSHPMANPERVARYYAELCRRYCHDTTLIVATSRAATSS